MANIHAKAPANNIATITSPGVLYAPVIRSFVYWSGITNSVIQNSKINKIQAKYAYQYAKVRHFPLEFFLTILNAKCSHKKIDRIE